MANELIKKHSLDDLVRGKNLSKKVELFNQLYSSDFEKHLATRHLLFRLLSELPEEVGSLSIDKKLRKGLLGLRERDSYSFPNVCVEVLNYLGENRRFENIQYESFEDAPHIIFLTPFQKSGANPPLGQLMAVSFMDLLGIKTSVFDLAFGQDEYAKFRRAIEDEGSGIWFVSLGNLSNPLAKEDYKTIFAIDDTLKEFYDGARPRFLAGGMSASFNHRNLLENTPVEIVFKRYASIPLAEMVFDSGFSEPDDRRDNLELFMRISNLYIKGTEGKICRTREIETTKTAKRVDYLSQNPKKLKEVTYWLFEKRIDICSPFDFNPPNHLADPRAFKRKLHPNDLYYQLRMVRFLSAIGNCQRGCEPCQYHNFDKGLFMPSEEEVIRKLNDLVKAIPEAEIISFGDDDFLYFRKCAHRLMTALQNNELTNGRLVYSSETVPQSINEKTLQELMNTGFRSVLVGIEGFVERIVRATKKLRDNESWEQFIAAPKKAHDFGLYTRASVMFYYPTITEEELAYTVEGAVDLINHGISIVLFPFVRAEASTKFASDRTEHFVRQERHTLPNNREIFLDYVVLPDNKVIRGFSEDSVRDSYSELGNILAHHNFGDTYSSQLEILAFLSCVVKRWKSSKGREISDSGLAELENYIKDSLAKLAKKSRLQLEVKSLVSGPLEYSSFISQLDANGEVGAYNAIRTLKLYLDFGRAQEIETAAKLSARLISDLKYFDGSILLPLRLSLDYRLKYPLPQVRKAVSGALEVVNSHPLKISEGYSNRPQELAR